MARGQAQGIVRELRRFSARRTARIAVLAVRTLAGPPPDGTPRDTHFHSANWIPSVGMPREGTVGERPGRGGRREFRRVARTEQRAALASIEQGYRDVEQGPIFITNNAPAITRLNEGYSGQSPAGFVQRAIRTAVSQADRELGGRAGRFRR